MNRNYAIHILGVDAPANPADRQTNMVYVGSDEKVILAGFRIYVSDEVSP